MGATDRPPLSPDEPAGATVSRQNATRRYVPLATDAPPKAEGPPTRRYLRDPLSRFKS
jgi:hypothetical protein